MDLGANRVQVFFLVTLPIMVFHHFEQKEMEQRLT
jgi:hypothetical protein